MHSPLMDRKAQSQEGFIVLTREECLYRCSRRHGWGSSSYSGLRGHSEIVELLISEGAKTEAKTGDDEIVFDFANEEMVALIRKSIEERQK